MIASMGRIVLYRLSAEDADEVNRRRADFAAAVPGSTGFQAHVGSPVEAGQPFPAMVVRTGMFEGHDNICNLQVSLDGNDTLWVVSRGEGSGEGEWFWPPRV